MPLVISGHETGRVFKVYVRSFMQKVYAKQNRTGKTKWYKGVVIGKQGYIRTSMAIFDNPAKEYNEDKLLVKMSNGEKITVWRSETFNAIV